MELMDGDEIKRELIRKTVLHREEIEGDVKMITQNTEKIITNALIIGGSLTLAYLLVRQLSGSTKKKSKKKAPKIRVVNTATESAEAEALEHENVSSGLAGQLGAALASQASVFLLNLAKEKLMEYLEQRAQKKQA